MAKNSKFSEETKEEGKTSDARNEGKGSGRQNNGRRNNRSDGSKRRSNDANYKGFTGNAVTSTLINDVAKISFNNQVGAPLNFNTLGFPTDPFNTQSPPGVMYLDHIGIPGVLSDANDGCNIAASLIYQRMRANLSTVASYQAADIMMYVLALAHIQAMATFITRLFRIVNGYDMVNLNYPNALLKASGLNEDAIEDFKHSLNDYRSRFNMDLYRASTLYLPTQFHIAERMNYLYSNVFWDSDDIKSQIIMFGPYATYLWSDTADSQGSSLRFTGVKNSVNMSDMNALLSLFESMIEAIRNSDSCNKIASDMRRAYGDDNSYTFMLVMENDVIVPLKDDAILSQVENSVICPTPPFNNDTFNITQEVNGNYAKFQPVFTVTNWYEMNGDHRWDGAHLLNAHWNSPTSEDIINMTQLHAVLTSGNDAGTKVRVASAKFDLIVGCRIYTTTNGTVDNGTAVSTFSGVSSVTPEWIYKWITFDWAPIVYLGLRDGTTNAFTANTIHPLVEIDNYTIADQPFLINLDRNYTCIGWEVPTSYTVK